MNVCGSCGMDAPPDVKSCRACGRPFAKGERASTADAATPAKKPRRPRARKKGGRK